MSVSRRVLVVDDAELAGTTLLRIVGRGGWEGRWVASAAEAEQAAKTWAPDAVLLDRNLPDGDGIELAGRLRRLLPEARLVLLSGDQVPEADLVGVDGYLLKPAAARAVLDALKG